jgi:prepilin-type N-terminal cleavage/methylation domain-containing protein
MAEDAMGNNRGFTLLELLVTAGFIGVAAAVAIPAMNNAVARNRVITGAELLAAQIREARLAAISRNQRFRVAFDCPTAGAIRMLEVTGDASVDDDADRCTANLDNDGPPVAMGQNLTFGADAPPTLEISARGQISAIGGAMPQNLSVTYGSNSRTVVVTATGRVAVTGS